MTETAKRVAIPLLLVAAAAGLCAPLCTHDFYASHELLSYPYRVMALHTSLAEGQIYARWFSDFAQGHGYPLLDFYAPLVFYLAEGFHLLGLGVLVALKAVIFLIFWGAGLACYRLARDEFTRAASLVAAACYMSSGYLLTDIYVRGNLAEALAFVWLPLLLWTTGRAAATGHRHWVAGVAVAVAVLTLTHNITAMLGVPLGLLYGLRWLRPDAWGKIVRLAGGYVLGLGMSSFFWIPAMLERRFVHLEWMLSDYYDWHRNFIRPGHWWAATGELLWPLTSDGVYAHLGVVQILLGLVGLAALIAYGLRKQGSARFYLALALASILLASPLSHPFWSSLKLLSFVQFPWRLLLFLSLATAMLAGRGCDWLTGEAQGRARWGILLASGLVALLPSLFAVSAGEATVLTPARIAILALAVVIGWWAVGTSKRVAARALYGWCAAAAVTLGIGFTLGPLVAPQDLSGASFSPESYARYEIGSGFVGTTIRNEYLPIWVSQWPPTGPARAFTAEPPAEMSAAPHRGLTARAQFRCPATSQVIYHVFYFPGWRAEVDGRPVRIEAGSDGLIRFQVPLGEHTLRVHFGLTGPRLAGNLIAWACALAVAVLLFLPGGRRTGAAGQEHRVDRRPEG